MKSTKLLIVLLLLAIIAISCKKDDLLNSNDMRNKYKGEWRSETKSLLYGNITDTVSIYINPLNSSQVTIANFYDTGINEYTFADAESSSLVIPNQTVSKLKISGIGILIEKNKITWNYTVNLDGTTDKVTAVFTKL